MSMLVRSDSVSNSVSNNDKVALNERQPPIWRGSKVTLELSIPTADKINYIAGTLILALGILFLEGWVAAAAVGAACIFYSTVLFYTSYQKKKGLWINQGFEQPQKIKHLATVDSTNKIVVLKLSSNELLEDRPQKQAMVFKQSSNSSDLCILSVPTNGRDLWFRVCDSKYNDWKFSVFVDDKEIVMDAHGDRLPY